MNLETLRDYLAFLADAEQALNRRRQTFLHLNSFSFYTLLAPKAQPALDSHMIVQFIASFTYNFQPPQLQKLLNDSSFQLLPEERPLSREELLAHGVDLFLKRYTRTGTMSF